MVTLSYSSSDSLKDDKDNFRYSIEYLNTLCPAGLPRHLICLKPGIPLMLLRNLCPQKGLCNGTRLIFQQIHGKKLLECTISGGEHGGRTVLIPRITLMPKDNIYTFTWSRRQFPVRTAFAMTINKVSQSVHIVFLTQILLSPGPGTNSEVCGGVAFRASVWSWPAECGSLKGRKQGQYKVCHQA